MIAPIGNSLTPNAMFLPLGLDDEKSSYELAKLVVQFDPSKSAEPPIICGNFSANSSKDNPNACLVDIRLSPKSGTDNDSNI